MKKIDRTKSSSGFTIKDLIAQSARPEVVDLAKYSIIELAGALQSKTDALIKVFEAKQHELVLLSIKDKDTQNVLGELMDVAQQMSAISYLIKAQIPEYAEIVEALLSRIQ